MAPPLGLVRFCSQPTLRAATQWAEACARCVSQVQRYSADQALFFRDFTAAYLKLSVDGATTVAGKKFFG